MKRTINKVTVLGSGIMGSRIACHFANIGVEVLLLDISPKELNEQEKAKGLSLDDQKVKNRIVTEAFQSAVKSNPSPLYHKDMAGRVTLGNYDDDMARTRESDWIIEVVVENLSVKQQVFEQVEKYRTPGTLITSNTSGIPIHLMLEGRSEDFQKHFCGTHFFNPPRYLRLLEVIPTPKTDHEVVDFLMHYGDLYLGKTAVKCKDTPAFIANRVGIYAIMKVLDSMQKLGLNIDEVDKLTGTVIGRPKSATFRTSDVVGLDTMVHVANNLHKALEHDEARDIFKIPDFVQKMFDNKMLGEKTKKGFYKKIKNDKGESEIYTLNLGNFEYEARKKVKFPTLEMAKPVEGLKERLPMLMAGQDKAAEFYRDSFFGLFQYVTNRIPEISDELYRIDDALKAGFGWSLGPFETWDAVNVQKTVEKMKEAGYAPAQWVEAMLGKGIAQFYKYENGTKYYYDINQQDYQVVPGQDDFIILSHLPESQVVWKNAGAVIQDLGDGILNVEFKSKMNTMGSEVVQGINKGIELAEKDYRGLVISNEGANFSVGANLGIIFMYAVEQDFDEVEMMVRQFQNTIMRARYSSIPVIVAPHDMTLGGACELTMHADGVQAAAETYVGLVEVGVGLVPAGGGTKEMAYRVSESLEQGDVHFNKLQNALMNIATAKVATSAHEAQDMHIITDKDRVSINKNRQVAEAKAWALEMAERGYTKPAQQGKIKVLGKEGMANFYAGINGMRMGHYITEHDAKIAQKIAWIMCGGDLSSPQEVSEQYLLDLEREAFLSLCGEKKTLERVQSVLNGGKPVRN